MSELSTVIRIFYVSWRTKNSGLEFRQELLFCVLQNILVGLRLTQPHVHRCTKHWVMPPVYNQRVLQQYYAITCPRIYRSHCTRVQITVCVMKPCSSGEWYRGFGGIFCSHIYGPDCTHIWQLPASSNPHVLALSSLNNTNWKIIVLPKRNWSFVSELLLTPFGVSSSTRVHL